MARGERAGRDDLIAAAEGEIDRLYAPLARRVYEAFGPYRDQPRLEIVTYAEVMHRIAVALAYVFGGFPGDEQAPLYRLLVRRGEREWERIFGAHAEQVHACLDRDPELHEAVVRHADQPHLAAVRPDVETWTDPKGRRLLDRVWLARTDTWRKLDQEIRVAIVMEEPPAQLALRLRRWLSPAQAHTRNRLGVLE